MIETAPFSFAQAEHPLAPLTLYNVGGPARLALTPGGVEEACEAYRWMVGQKSPWMVLGGGSNVLFADSGFPGIVLITSRLNALDELGEERYWIEAGVELGQVVRSLMVPNNYDGVGGLTGIPGAVGGALYMNAGTVNGSVCQLVESVEIIDPSGRRTAPMREELFGYRRQTFCPPGGLILGGVFRFARAETDQRAIYDHYTARRERTQPKGYCCGSVFKNPPGDHAARMIEACGLKGARQGGAVISEMHANFIMNEANASSADILDLIKMCQREVKERFGVELEEEVKIVA